MQDGIVVKISEWSNAKLSDEELLQHLEDARPSIEDHRKGFQEVTGDLKPLQKERCAELISFCFLLMDQMDAALDQAIAGVKDGDRNSVLIAGDNMARDSFQLNRAFIEFRNVALAALGPSDIPNLNLLLSRRDEFLEDPGDLSAQLFQEAIDSERIVVYHSMEDLTKEPNLPEVATLSNCFWQHMGQLNKLSEVLNEDGEEGEFDEIFEQLEKGYLELQDLVPMVQMKLRSQGETEYPDLNFLLNLIEDVGQGNIGDGPFLDALEAVEESFTKSRELLTQAAGQLDSTLANDEIDGVLESFEEFDDAIEALYRFLEERDRAWLVEGRGCLLDFAKLFAQHQKRLKEIEAQQGQLLCPMCGTANEATRSRCAKCGGPLPQNVAAAATTTFETKEKGDLGQQEPDVLVTANLAKLYTAVNQVAAGEIGHDVFLEAVTRFESLVEANVGALPAEPEMPNPEAQVQVEKIYDAFQDGVEKFRSAIDIFRTFPEKNDEEVLAQAVTLVDEGAKLIASAGETVKR